ncbi:alpha,alpha-trehalose-phosphate synthase (UDP-forming) [Elioraea rosea]|uniref:alpha,alpha-trehalose-phosphate synthase (UDP-forming) n=1 Tax=Elioraea rosea TaxID=2492390 RepID=UPI00118281E6|nr:trehalose-6-phosphate synthase [Elioraea rosea]
MSRLVIVSNRVPVPKPRSGPHAGGLAVALAEALAGREALWFGWSGETAGSPGVPSITTVGQTTYATLALNESEKRGYYGGFSNGTLWPLLHYRMGLAEFRREDHEIWRAVNNRFAAALAPLLRPDDVLWVHDFHLFPFAAALRSLGCRQRIGFFLHVPFPPAALFDALPQGRRILEDLGAFDLLGMQTEADANNLREALAGVDVATPVQAFPVGMDSAGFARDAEKAAAMPETKRLAESLGGRSLILGIDRLDYSKGLPHRFRGYAALLKRFPEHRRNVTFLQVAPVSRNEVAQYRALRRELDELAGRINGEYGEIDWIPIRWMTRALPRATLAGFHRIARIGLVTPLRDGMNLVAKEFVAAQNPADPGVLVLSRFAGAAAELRGAILVNPNDPDEIAEGLDVALRMEEAERRRRAESDRAALAANSAADWAKRFLVALDATGTSVGRAA